MNLLISLIQAATDARRTSALSEISFIRGTSSALSADSLPRAQPESGGKEYAESGKEPNLRVTTKVNGTRFGSSHAADSFASGIGTLSSRPSSSGSKQLEQVKSQPYYHHR